ncbi:hypothetical protein [Hymenobacter actinosclerus]|uniref:VWFA domain-containing protein n=1 Tax=Hymenobacter actinosclerus TaxID=82805 RepID=A0A1I0DL02_9BACT|nr:hypothetical protein [Hymenobacter actinosclerus]SET32506.1 hypothetical protein SAMN04487998_1429 [Hymenobacter actinosclerus]
MGYSRWSDDAFDFLSNSRVGANTDDIFANNRRGRASDQMLPTGLKFRESRDSDVHPESLAIAVFLDETGSMGRIPEIMVREKLGPLMNTLIAHGVEHPQILFGGIGDHHSDQYPLQVGQFESGTDELDQWLTGIYLEGNGGGQSRESYTLAWLVTARHTSIDCFEKRGVKGFLFTIGDEAAWDVLQGKALQKLLGYAEADDVTDRQLLEEAQRSYHVFHIHVNEGAYRDDANVLGYWKKMLGERLIILNDYNAIAETIASTVALVHGVQLSDILASFDQKTAGTVRHALGPVNSSLITQAKGSASKGGVVSL